MGHELSMYFRGVSCIYGWVSTGYSETYHYMVSYCIAFHPIIHSWWLYVSLGVWKILKVDFGEERCFLRILRVFFARTVSTCPNYNLNISPFPARTISTCPTYTQSHFYACAQYCFNRGNDDASQSINMNITHNHLNYLNYTGEINKTQPQGIQVNNISANAHMLWHSQISIRIL